MVVFQYVWANNCLIQQHRLHADQAKCEDLLLIETKTNK